MLRHPESLFLPGKGAGNHHQPPGCPWPLLAWPGSGWDPSSPACPALPVCVLLPWLPVTESPRNLLCGQGSPDSHFPRELYNSFSLLRWEEMSTGYDTEQGTSQGPELAAQGAAEDMSKRCRDIWVPLEPCSHRLLRCIHALSCGRVCSITHSAASSSPSPCLCCPALVPPQPPMRGVCQRQSHRVSRQTWSGCGAGRWGK